MMEALEELWSKFSLTEDEQSDIIVEQERVNDPTKVKKNYALGKLVMRKPMNLEAMKNVFIKIWNISMGFLSEKLVIGCKYFIFRICWKKTRHFRSNPGRLINLF